MKLTQRIWNFIGRVLRGEDVVLVPQPKSVWDTQYEDGTWDYALHNLPNTTRLYEIIMSGSDKETSHIRVLDIGCGHGALGKMLTAHAGITYVGVDFSSKALSQARSNVKDGMFILHDIEQPLSNLEGRFDFIVFNEVLYYVNPQKVLSLYKKYAGPHTRVVISVVSFKLPLRSWFIWRRIQQAVMPLSRERVHSAQGNVAWDMLIAKYV